MFACPNGKCKEIQWYSDYDLELEHYGLAGTIPFYSENVKCNSLTVNTDELRIRFTSDGQLAGFEDTNPTYKGFSAAYWSSPSSADEEHVGCPQANTTLSGTEGSVFAFEANKFTNDRDLWYPFWIFWYEFENRGCAGNSGEACSVFGRGQSKWWIISPPKEPGDKIFVAFREVILDDNLDVLNIYTRTNNVTTKEASLTGANPFSHHKAEKCTGCMSSCGLYVGAAGTILEWSNQTRNGKSTCVWIIDVASLGFKDLSLVFEAEMLRETDRMTITACRDSRCQRVFEWELSPYRPGNFYSETGVIKITWNSDGYGSYQGFQASWTGLCKSDPEITPSGRLSRKHLPQGYPCVWTIAPTSAQNVTVDFTYLAGGALVYSGSSLIWDPENDELLGHANSDNNQTTFSSDTGMVHIMNAHKKVNVILCEMPMYVFIQIMRDGTDVLHCIINIMKNVIFAPFITCHLRYLNSHSCFYNTSKPESIIHPR